MKLLFIFFAFPLLFCISFGQEETNYVYWPVRFDLLLGEYLFTQLPFSVGLPFDVGIGFTQKAPLGGFYAYGQYLREKKVLFLTQLIEKRQIKLFVGVSTDLLFEVKYDHYFSDTVDVRKVPVIQEYTQLLPIVFNYQVRFLGSATNPSLISDGFIKAAFGPYEGNLFFQSVGTVNSFEFLADAGVHLLDYQPFSLSLGEIYGAGGILFEEKERRFSPRMVFGYVPSANTVGFGFIVHQEIPIEKSTLYFRSSFVFPMQGDGYWNFSGEWKHPDDHSFVFSISSKNVYVGGRWLIKLPASF